MRYIKADINQVTIDGNNLIPKNIRDACYEKFKNVPDFELPEMIGSVSHTKSFFLNDTKILIEKENSELLTTSLLTK
jgi:hypothetical protein